MASTGERLTAARYETLRRKAVSEIARAIVRNPPDGPVSKAIPRYVRSWVDSHYDDVLAGYDPGSIESAVPTDPHQVESSASTPLSAEDSDDDHRRELHAAHTVRADLILALREGSSTLERAIAVHDTCKRLVDHRGSNADRRPAALIDSFATWVEQRHGPAAGDWARERFTPLHVMRIDGLGVVDPKGKPADIAVLNALEEYLGETFPEQFAPRPDSGSDQAGSSDQVD